VRQVVILTSQLDVDFKVCLGLARRGELRYMYCSNTEVCGKVRCFDRLHLHVLLIGRLNVMDA